MMFKVAGLSILLLAVVLAAEEMPPGMARYVVGLLRTPPNPPAVDKEEASKVQEAHMAHLGSMADSGLLIGAGPILSKGDLRGILVFKDTPLGKLRVITDADPWVKRGRLVCDLLPWMGPAGIGQQYADAKKANPASPDKMVKYQFVLLRKGPVWTAEATPEAQKLQEAHQAHIKSLSQAGTLIAAGPFLHSGDPRGVLVFKAASPEESKHLAGADPAVQAGRLTLEVHEWMVAEGVIPNN
jgi:uncharacterized protein YciI